MPKCPVFSIDSCLGLEADYVILSMVKTDTETRTSLRNIKRLCVALTRARHGLIILANERYWSIMEEWKELIRYYKMGDLFVADGVKELSRFFNFEEHPLSKEYLEKRKANNSIYEQVEAKNEWF